ncbi:hypothetical protein [Streptacidiphilus sp. EB129]|jgi:hypothetical protein|uniref:hypothetical protein n=1 Tax=Streptacidiphilus sp. EB129 TaxID=3156262 RepID=UPI0035167A97
MNEYSSNTITVREAGPDAPCRLAAEVCDHPGHAVAPDVSVAILKDVAALADRYRVRPDHISYEGDAERIIEANSEGSPG